MIILTRLNGSQYILNCDLIETIEATPDTVITTVYGKKMVVSNTIDEVVEKVVQYKGKMLFVNKLLNIQEIADSR